MEVLFWAVVVIVCHVYVGYPALLWLIARLGGARPVRHAELEPAVTLVISAYNEERVIAEKIVDALALDYPPAKLQIMVVSDASSDRTDEITELADDCTVFRNGRSRG